MFINLMENKDQDKEIKNIKKKINKEKKVIMVLLGL
jgi:hypothetical protein